MDAIPIEWIDKLFNCLEEFYGDRWRNLFDDKHRQSMSKATWQNGLQGLTHNNIKAALILCKRAAMDYRAFPPNVIEFFHYAKAKAQPIIDYSVKVATKPDPLVAHEALKEIMEKLRAHA